MNILGPSLRPFLKAHPPTAPDTAYFIIYDHLDKDEGYIQVRKGGSANGHNGMRSCLHTLGPEKENVWQVSSLAYQYRYDILAKLMLPHLFAHPRSESVSVVQRTSVLSPAPLRSPSLPRRLTLPSSPPSDVNPYPALVCLQIRSLKHDRLAPRHPRSRRGGSCRSLAQDARRRLPSSATEAPT
jgi:hypothetical protein